MQCSIIHYSYHAVHHIPMTYLFYNWKFVPLTLFTHFAHSLPFSLAITNWFSASISLFFFFFL